MMKTLFVTTALAFSAVSASAATLVGWEGVNGTAIGATDLSAGVSGGNLFRDKGVTQNAGGTFNSRGWHDAATKQEAIDEGNALYFGLSIDPSMPYNLSELVFDYDRSNTGPMSIAIDMFINNVDEGEVFRDVSVDNSANQFEAVDLTHFTNVTGDILFRLVGWGATNPLGTFDIENDLMFGGDNYGILLKGEAVAPVPLPAGLPLLATAGLALGWVGRKRRAA